jgi:cephalosporin hydroxylase
MLLQEISPEVIIEYGSGSGGSAIWMADMLSVTNMNFKPDGKIYSYDIKKPECDHDMIEFIELDLTESREWHWQEGRKLVIEDAHVNITEVLLQTDNMLESGDYLIVEDSGTVEKQKSISEFLQNAKNTYEIDQYYLDFFGMNVGSCVDSIFKVK